MLLDGASKTGTGATGNCNNSEPSQGLATADALAAAQEGPPATRRGQQRAHWGEEEASLSSLGQATLALGL